MLVFRKPVLHAPASERHVLNDNPADLSVGLLAVAKKDSGPMLRRTARTNDRLTDAVARYAGVGSQYKIAKNIDAADTRSLTSGQTNRPTGG